MLFVESCQSEALNLRLKGRLEGGNYDFKDLYYLSPHTLDSAAGLAYAKSRVSRDLLDQWLSKRISFQGRKFDDSAIQLSDQERCLEVGSHGCMCCCCVSLR